MHALISIDARMKNTREACAKYAEKRVPSAKGLAENGSRKRPKANSTKGKCLWKGKTEMEFKGGGWSSAGNFLLSLFRLSEVDVYLPQRD